MIWLNITEYLSFMTTDMFRIFNNSNTAGAARETSYHSEDISGFRAIRAAQSLVFQIMVATVKLSK
jgi:hypothetical protein